jgi:molybdenum cofactor cytidylyltransferase
MICAIVPAAGRSRRMGGGVQKLLLPLGGTTVIARVVDQLLDALPDSSRVIVITRAGETGVAEALATRPIEIVSNPLPDGDMLSSIRAGIRAAAAGCGAFLIAPGDQPTIPADVIRLMVAAFTDCPDRIIVPSFEGRRGHPILFSSSMATEVLSLFDGEGLRGLLRLHAGAVVELPVTSRGVVDDIDTPDDYTRLSSGM